MLFYTQVALILAIDDLGFVAYTKLLSMWSRKIDRLERFL